MGDIRLSFHWLGYLPDFRMVLKRFSIAKCNVSPRNMSISLFIISGPADLPTFDFFRVFLISSICILWSKGPSLDNFSRVGRLSSIYCEKLLPLLWGLIFNSSLKYSIQLEGEIFGFEGYFVTHNLFYSFPSQARILSQHRSLLSKLSNLLSQGFSVERTFPW